MNSVIILLDNPGDWKPYYETNSVLTVSDYLKHKSAGRERRLVINLSNDYSYNSEGYYASLLAQARGHRVIPDVQVINKLESGSGIRMDRSLQKLCYQWITKNDIKDDIWFLNIYFGTCREKGLEKIARFIFDNYPCPILRVGFNTRPKNQIESVQSIPLNALTSDEQDYFAEALDSFNKKVWRSPRLPKTSRYSLAILHDPQEKFPPSDHKALNKFLEIAKKTNVYAELITEEDATRLMEFDALFIRATTSLNHYTFHLSQRAVQHDMAVIDDRCRSSVARTKCISTSYWRKRRYPLRPRCWYSGPTTIPSGRSATGWEAVHPQNSRRFLFARDQKNSRRGAVTGGILDAV